MLGVRTTPDYLARLHVTADFFGVTMSALVYAALRPWITYAEENKET